MEHLGLWGLRPVEEAPAPHYQQLRSTQMHVLRRKRLGTKS